MTTTPANITTLRENLNEIVSELRAGQIQPATAEAISNASGKIIASIRVQLEYERARGKVPSIAFMD